MGIRLASACAAIVLLVSGRPCPCAPFPLTLRDSRGVSVTVTSAPKRIISLTPGTTEMLFALGAGPHVVGDTTWCNYPPQAKLIAKIGDHTPNYERIVALRPDLVVVDDIAETTASDRLRSLRIPVFTIHPTTYESVEDTIVTLGRLLGNSQEGIAVKAAMQQKLAQARRAMAPLSGRKPRVLVVVGTDPLWVAGPQTLMGELITLCGASPAQTSGSAYSTISREWLIGHQPDVILADSSDQAALRSDPLLSHLIAVRTNRMADTGGDLTVRPGPRLGDGLLGIAHSLLRLCQK